MDKLLKAIKVIHKFAEEISGGNMTLEDLAEWDPYPEPAPIPIRKWLNHVIFIIEGTFMVIGNFLILATILRHKKLRRKELLLLAGLALGDGVYGIGIFYGGFKRLFIVLSRADYKITAWECASYFQTPCYWFGAQCSALMMIMTSVDRFIAVQFFRDFP